MLNKDEAHKLGQLRDKLRVQRNRGMTMMYPMQLDDLEWLAEKLKEVNEELKVAQKCSSDLMRAAQEQYEKHAHCRHN